MSIIYKIIESITRVIFTPEIIITHIDTRMSNIKKIQDTINLPYHYSVIITFVALCVENFLFFTVITNVFVKFLLPKQKAYILSIRASYILGVAGVFHNIDYLYSNVSHFNSDSMLFLAAYLVSDTLIGYYHYPNYLKSLSGYPHHIIYSILIAISFILDINTPFSLFLVEEIPTFLLSMGSFEPAFKNYILFGVVFFLSRIVFHTFLLVSFYETSIFIAIFGSLSLFLHSFWFIGLLKKITL